MDLKRALRLDGFQAAPCVGFTGAGGKTTAIFHLAHQLPRPVWVATTTHLGIEQLGFGDRHFIWQYDTLNQLTGPNADGVSVVTGAIDLDSGKATGLDDEGIQTLFEAAQARGIPLLVEADGSRQLPLKTPADHEPALPDFVDHVVVVAGLSGLGKPLSEAWVHRTGHFAARAGLAPGEIISVDGLARVLCHPLGGLKRIPRSAKRTLLLNQADTPELQAQGHQIATRAADVYDAVVVSSLALPDTAPDVGTRIYARHERTAAVILAAGGSHRFGQPKQLLDWGGKSLIWHVVKRAVRAGLHPVCVVCGDEVLDVMRALDEFPVEIVHNMDWRQGQSSSIRCGVNAVAGWSQTPLGRSVGSALFMMADQPQLPVGLIRTLVEDHAQHGNPITGPLVDGQRANPVLFDQETFDDLAALSGDVGGRQLFSKYPVRWLPWHDRSPLFDVDTPDDYARLLEMKP